MPPRDAHTRAHQLVGNHIHLQLARTHTARNSMPYLVFSGFFVMRSGSDHLVALSAHGILADYRYSRYSESLRDNPPYHDVQISLQIPLVAPTRLDVHVCAMCMMQMTQLAVNVDLVLACADSLFSCYQPRVAHRFMAAAAFGALS